MISYNFNIFYMFLYIILAVKLFLCSLSKWLNFILFSFLFIWSNIFKLRNKTPRDKLKGGSKAVSGLESNKDHETHGFLWSFSSSQVGKLQISYPQMTNIF